MQRTNDLLNGSRIKTAVSDKMPTFTNRQVQNIENWACADY